MNFEQRSREYREYIEAYLANIHKAYADQPQQPLFQAMDYSLLAGGKRLRPVFAFDFCRMCGADWKKAVPFAAAIEMIHTYSLIHDDLPSMDNDDFRRGRPTNHKVYGEANALLAGDALLTRAFGVAASNPCVDPAVTARAVALIADCAGEDGMIGGQVLDLMGEEEKYGVDTLELMQALKTGELIRCASLLGCYAGGASEALIEAAEKYSLYVGRAFQIIDDILDAVGDADILGKPIGSDAESEKTTFLTHMTVDEAREYAARLTADAKKAISAFKGSEVLSALADYLLTRQK